MSRWRAGGAALDNVSTQRTRSTRESWHEHGEREPEPRPLERVAARAKRLRPGASRRKCGRGGWTHPRDLGYSLSEVGKRAGDGRATSISAFQLALLLSQFCGLNTLPAL